MKLRLPYAIIRHGYANWVADELVEEAKAYGKDADGKIQRTPPNRSEREAVPSDEITVKPSANTLRRAQAFA